MYPEIMVIPMREELTRLGIEELRSAADVDRFVQNESGTTMVVVNSICGCAAGRMRPAVRLALQNAASIAALMLTTEALIADIGGEEKMAAAGAGPGGMSGMY